MRGGAATARPCNFPRSGTESPAARRRIKWDPGTRTKTEAKEIHANKNRSAREIEYPYCPAPDLRALLEGRK